MIVANIGPRDTFFRMLTPEWASLPKSGAGAARNGGRFNRPGVQALYLSISQTTAIAEYQQDDKLMPPGTLATYLVTAPNVVDFSGGYNSTVWPDIFAHARCDWKWINRIEKKIPKSWLIGDDLIRSGYHGLLYPSVRDLGGTNLVIFCCNLDSTCEISVHDPDGQLPHDRSSWM
jgi:RES domain-containing protein